MTKYQVYDVFTQTAFGGNQLAVVSGASALPEEDLQSIARAFNYSETTFVFPPSNSENTARVRIFSPKSELPFAGHPTIGTAIAIAEQTGQTDLVLELGVGPIPCKVKLGKPSSAAFTTKVPLKLYGEVPTDLIAKCLGIDSSKIAVTNHKPTIASVGLPFAMVEIVDEGGLNEAAPVTEQFKKTQMEYANDIDLFAAFLYVRDGHKIKARMFDPLNNIPEDPATGSASAALGAFFSGLENTSLELMIEQGVAMGRPSKISVTANRSESGDCAVTIEGSAVETMRGELVYSVSSVMPNR